MQNCKTLKNYFFSEAKAASPIPSLIVNSNDPQHVSPNPQLSKNIPAPVQAAAAAAAAPAMVSPFALYLPLNFLQKFLFFRRQEGKQEQQREQRQKRQR